MKLQKPQRLSPTSVLKNNLRSIRLLCFILLSLATNILASTLVQVRGTTVCYNSLVLLCHTRGLIPDIQGRLANLPINERKAHGT